MSIQKLINHAAILCAGLFFVAWTDGVVVNSDHNYAPVSGATVVWGSSMLYSPAIYSGTTLADGSFAFSNSSIVAGQTLVSVVSGGKTFVYRVDHEYGQTCKNGAAAVSCSDDVFDIGDSPATFHTFEATVATTPTELPIHMPDVCLSRCFNSYTAPVQLYACTDACATATPTQPIADDRIVYELIGPPLSGAPGQARITVRVTVTNPTIADMTVSRIDLLGQTVADYRSKPRKLAASSSVEFQNCLPLSELAKDKDFCRQTIPLVMNVPIPVTGKLAVYGADANVPIAQITLPLSTHLNDHAPLSLVGAADDLLPNEFYGATSNHVADFQFFDVDIGVAGWNQATSTWDSIYPGSDKTLGASYRVYGRPMRAMADGTVCYAVNDQPEKPTTGGTAPTGPTWGAGGNHIAINSGNEIYLIAHLQPGSIPPELLVPGTPVKKGQYLGKAGMSGNTSAPAPHFQIMENTTGAPILGTPENSCDQGINRPIGFSSLQSATMDEATHSAILGLPINWSLLNNQSVPNPMSLLYPATGTVPWCRTCTDDTEYIGVVNSGTSIDVRVKAAGWTAFLAAWTAREKDSFRLTQIETFPESGQQQFVGIFTRATGPSDDYQPSDLLNTTSWSTLNGAINTQFSNGRRLVDVVTYLDHSTRYFVGVFRAGNGAQTVVPPSDATSFGSQWVTLSGQGLRLSNLTSYDASGTRKFIGVYRAGNDGYSMYSSTDFGAFYSDFSNELAVGLRLVDLETYPIPGGMRVYTGVYRSGNDAQQLITISGYANYIQAMESWVNVFDFRSIDLNVVQ